MKTNSTLALSLGLYVLLVAACNNKPHTDFSKLRTTDVYVIGKDTCNMTDGDGLRQGKWVPYYNNDLKDTVYYKDGKIVPKAGA